MRQKKILMMLALLLTAASGATAQTTYFVTVKDGKVTGISSAIAGAAAAGKAIYTIDGKKLNNLQKGVNIIRLPNGKTQKVIIR